MLQEADRSVAPKGHKSLNYNLYCAIYAATALKIELRDIIHAVHKHADFVRGEYILSENVKWYLSNISAGQVFCLLSDVDHTLELRNSPSNLALIAGKIANGCRRFREGTEEITKPYSLDEALIGFGRLYDPPTCATYMLLHAWRENRTPEECRLSAHKPDSQKEAGLDALAMSILADLNFRPKNDRALANVLSDAIDLLIMANPHGWNEITIWPLYWSDRLDQVCV